MLYDYFRIALVKESIESNALIDSRQNNEMIEEGVVVCFFICKIFKKVILPLIMSESPNT